MKRRVNAVILVTAILVIVIFSITPVKGGLTIELHDNNDTIFYQKRGFLDRGRLSSSEEDRIRESATMSLLVALKDHNNTAVYDMFSKRAIECDPDFNATVEKACDYIQGEILNVEYFLAGTSGSNHYGRKHLIVNIRCIIYTNLGAYTVWGRYRWQNYTDADTELVGFQFVYLIDNNIMADTTPEFYNGDGNCSPGFHLDMNDVEMPTVRTITPKLCNALFVGDHQTLIELFSERAIEMSDHLDEKINAVKSFVRGDIVDIGDITRVYCNGNRIDFNRVRRTIQWRVEVTTTLSSYLVITTLSIRNDWDPKEEGIWSVCIIQEDLWNRLDEDEQYQIISNMWSNNPPDIYLVEK